MGRQNPGGPPVDSGPRSNNLNSGGKAECILLEVRGKAEKAQRKSVGELQGRLQKHLSKRGGMCFAAGRSRLRCAKRTPAGKTTCEGKDHDSRTAMRFCRRKLWTKLPAGPAACEGQGKSPADQRPGRNAPSGPPVRCGERPGPLRLPEIGCDLPHPRRLGHMEGAPAVTVAAADAGVRT